MEVNNKVLNLKIKKLNRLNSNEGRKKIGKKNKM